MKDYECKANKILFYRKKIDWFCPDESFQSADVYGDFSLQIV